MAGSLNERERQVLEAVIETYVETAEPAGSRTISMKFGHTLSAATIRNTMSDLEEKGYLYHPHTSAGRIPTDLAYRVYVNSLMRLSQVSASDSHQIREELAVRVAVVLNERLAGLTLREIRATLSERLRDAAPGAGSSELLNIFIQEADDLFDVQPTGAVGGGVVLGSAQLLAGQPEFATK